MARASALAVLAATLALIVGGCSQAQPSGTSVRSSTPFPSAEPSRADALVARLIAVDAAIARWRSATDLGAVQSAAEETRNLIVGPGGPHYADADGNGVIEGANEIGLLPGRGGEPGLATDADGPCVVRDVLGGGWSDPVQRWAILETAIERWTPSRNTFPALPSHPQRIVGWATLALGTADIATALEYGGHARIHMDVSMRAATNCNE